MEKKMLPDMEITTSKHIRIRFVCNDLQPLFDIMKQIGNYHDDNIRIFEPRLIYKYDGSRTNTAVGFLAACDMFIYLETVINNLNKLKFNIPDSLHNREEYDETFEISIATDSDDIDEYDQDIIIAMRDSFHNIMVGNQDYIDNNIIISDQIDEENQIFEVSLAITNDADLDKIPREIKFFDEEVVKKAFENFKC